MSQQLGNPLGIGPVGLFPSPLFNISGIDNPYFYCVRQDMIDWLPVHSGTFHRNNGATGICQPLGQFGQSLHRGSVLTVVHANGAIGIYTPQTCGNTRLMNVQAATDRMNGFHGLPFSKDMMWLSGNGGNPPLNMLFLHAINFRLIEVPGPDRPIPARA
jgi:hypothetical protein